MPCLGDICELSDHCPLEIFLKGLSNNNEKETVEAPSSGATTTTTVSTDLPVSVSHNDKLIEL